jgi:hypothetical protein
MTHLDGARRDIPLVGLQIPDVDKEERPAIVNPATEKVQ